MLIAIIFYSEFEIIQLQREESAAISNVSGRCFLFCKCWAHWPCHYLQIPCTLSFR